MAAPEDAALAQSTCGSRSARWRRVSAAALRSRGCLDSRLLQSKVMVRFKVWDTHARLACKPH